MIEGYDDLRNELTEILGGDVSEEDIDAAVEALVNEDHVTATAALGELDSLAQTTEGKVKLRSMMATWITHERTRKDRSRTEQAVAALNHLLAAIGAERRQSQEKINVERRH
jgi:hypothetical protein